MQRRIDAVRQLEHSVSRRAARKAAADSSSRVTDETRHTTWQKQYLRDLVRTARVNRRQDYDCGPRLAPRRDIGEREFSYGAMHHRVLQPRKARPGPDGRARVPLIASGDRVVLLAGRDRGRIGEVIDVEAVSMTCRVRGLNEAALLLDDQTKLATNQTEDCAAYPMALPLAAVKLVHPLPSADAAGGYRDVVIDRLALRDVPNAKTLLYNPAAKPVRFIPGTNTVIPWPTETAEEHKTHADDTVRLNVHSDTDAKPVLLSAPMPTSVIDELRGKYSRFRTRHTAAYIAAKEAQAGLGKRRDEVLGRLVKTPLQEFHERRLEGKRAAAPRALSVEQMAAIGEAVARERAGL